MVTYNVLFNLYENGVTSVVRGLKTAELTDFRYILGPYQRFMCFDARKLKLDYVKQEFLWYYVGHRFDTSICKLATIWNDMVNEDGSINSNYGYYIFNPETCDGITSNFDRVVETLRQDSASRRAVITILNNQHMNEETKDYPCTAYINFLIRNNQLVMLVRMRSQDAIFGMGNDAPFFSFLHELLLVRLKVYTQFDELILGPYSHVADSFHVYERHYDMLESICENPVITEDYHDDCPQMTLETPALLDQLKELLLTNKPLDPIKGQDPFIDWLLTRDNPETLIYPDFSKLDKKND